MTLFELILAVVVILAATVAAIFNHLTSELAGLLGVAIGYVGKGVLTEVRPTAINHGEPVPFKGAPSE